MDGRIASERGRPGPGLRVVVASALLLSGGLGATADDAPRPLPNLARPRTGELRPARVDVETPAADPVAEIEVVDVDIQTEAPTVPGSKLVLEVGQGAPEGTRFRWIQTQGPAVEIADPTQGSIEVMVPADADHLGFLLVAASADGVRVARVSVPIQGAAARSSWGPRPTGTAKADAGDDQVGLAGRRVTLNSSRSKPADGKGARWIQAAGDPVLDPKQDGAYFSFVPPRPGTYRFLLMVAAEGEVSEPDEVTVEVGTPPTPPAAQIPAPAPAPPQPAAFAPTTPPTPAQVVSAALPRLADGARVGSSVADVMEAVAQRASLYESFAALQGELLRRLEVVVPADPAVRSAWNELVFAPLTAMTSQKLLAAGLDVGRPGAVDQPLTPSQQSLVREHFRELARAFRVIPASR